ncbi:MAG TPA: hydroxymethylglutaryl-CoA lyase [Woeseiaceae bacterium]|nr:hydroxymethylglutaryl-CoA lyase [Woeseiaceae bacterium]
MTRSLSIIEVGPRDGLQSEPEILPVATKVEFIRRAVDAGIRRLEVASFVNPKKVPQMAGAEELVAALPRRDDITYIGLVLNQRGFERARNCGIDEVGMVVVASDTYNRRNQGVSSDESVEAWLKIAEQAKAAGIRANIMVSSAFGCPFEGEVPPERVLEIVRRVAEAEPVELALADSIGVAVPAQVRDLLGRVAETVPGMPLRCHLHNTRNTGLANAQAALDAGVASLDASIGGIGGCPFAPAATGNIPTDDLVYLLERSGIETGVSLPKIIETSLWLEEQLGRGVPAMLPKAGIFPDVATKRAAAGG